MAQNESTLSEFKDIQTDGKSREGRGGWGVPQTHRIRVGGPGAGWTARRSLCGPQDLQLGLAGRL